MTDDLNPQAKEMAAESMARNLAAQADAIWPQEKPRLSAVARACRCDQHLEDGIELVRLHFASPKVGEWLRRLDAIRRVA